MWVCVMGAFNTAKEVVVKELQHQEFRWINNPVEIGPEDSDAMIESKYAMKRIRDHLDAVRVMNKENVFTVHSLLSIEPIGVAALKSERINSVDLNILLAIKDGCLSCDSFVPPHCVIYTKLERRDIQNRILLKGGQIVKEKEVLDQIEKYEELMPQVKAPLIELDMSKNPDQVKKDLQFSLDSIRSAGLHQSTIWKKRFV